MCVMPTRGRHRDVLKEIGKRDSVSPFLAKEVFGYDCCGEGV